MEDIVRALGKFLYRDYFYFVSGVAITITSLNSFEFYIFAPKGYGAILIWSYVGMLVAIGFINQEIWSQTPIIKTNCPETYPELLQSIYRRHTGTEWKLSNPTSRTGLIEDNQYQRIVNLKQICTSVGSALLTSIFILFASYIINCHVENLLTAICLVPIASAFIFGSWLHNMTQSAYEPLTNRHSEADSE